MLSTPFERRRYCQKEFPYSGCWYWVDQNVILGQCRMALQSFFNRLHRHLPERNTLLVDFAAELDDWDSPFQVIRLAHSTMVSASISFVPFHFNSTIPQHRSMGLYLLW